MMRAHIIAVIGTVLATAALAAGPSFEFMPDGGRTLFAEVFPGEAGRDALANHVSQEDWAAAITAANPDLETREARTLAGYLAANAPYESLAQLSDPSSDMPADGKDLALSRCQSCHSLFTGYLMQRRDEAAWRSTFASPFHVGIAMTPAELTTFVDYSAVNMPLRFEDVPSELRF